MPLTITTAVSNSWKKEVLMGTHQFKASAGHTFKLALLKAVAVGVGTYDKNTTNYSNVTANSDEVLDTSGNSQYTAGGFTMTPNADPSLGSDVAWIDWTTDPNWGPAVSLSSYGCILYNSTSAGASVAVFAFGVDKVSTTGSFTVILPVPTFNTAMLRLA